MTDSRQHSIAALDQPANHRSGFHVMRRLYIVVLAVLAIVVIGSLVIGRGEPPDPVIAPADPAGDHVVIIDETLQSDAGISIETVQSMIRTDIEEAPAVLTVDETRTTRIGSMVDGMVIETKADVGSRVAAGQLLGVIHSHVVHDSWADYRKAGAERRRMTTELTYAEQSERRALRLYEAKAISFQQVERARADRVSAEQQLDIAKTELQRSIERLEHYGIVSGDDLSLEAGEEIPVRAPLAGVVLDRLVTPGTAVTTGMPMFVVSDLGTLWAVAEIAENRLSHVAVDRSVEIRVSAYPDETFSGTITFIGDTINPRTRRVTVRSTVPNRDGRLKPEMFATVGLGESDARSILVVPDEAIQEIDGQPVVFVISGASTDTFRLRKVVLGSSVDGWVEVRSGLTEGEQIASAGSFLLKSELLEDKDQTTSESG